MTTAEITETVARKVLTAIDAGLSHGLGKQVPGEMCIEAAVCHALGLPHGDDPACVSRAVRSLKISLNDRNWSSRAARAKGLRRLGLAQLGSAGTVDDREFARRVAELAIRQCVPAALRAAASINKNAEHRAELLAAANKCEVEGTRASVKEAQKTAAAAADAIAADAAAAAAADAAAAAAADAAAVAVAVAYAVAAADAAAYAVAAADAAARDKVFADFAEGVVQILIAMNAPGCQWLPLTEPV